MYDIYVYELNINIDKGQCMPARKLFLKIENDLKEPFFSH